jgi:hypothetical protein
MENISITWTRQNMGKKFFKGWSLNEWEYVEPLIDVSFIEMWTDRISNLVLYPAIPVVLLFAAGSPYFDNYGYNPYHYVVLVFLGLLILAPAFWLRSEARKLQKKKIKKAREKLEYSFNGAETSRKKIEFAIKETENLKEGAFEPFWEHPFMPTILVLIGGINAPTFLSMISRSL